MTAHNINTHTVEKVTCRAKGSQNSCCCMSVARLSYVKVCTCLSVDLCVSDWQCTEMPKCQLWCVYVCVSGVVVESGDNSNFDAQVWSGLHCKMSYRCYSFRTVPLWSFT